MFGIGMQELILIFVLALILVGPKQLPDLARALGKGYAEFRRAFDDMKQSVEREIRADDLRRSLRDLPPPPGPPGRPANGPPNPYPEVFDPAAVAAGPQPPPPPEPERKDSGTGSAPDPHAEDAGERA